MVWLNVLQGQLLYKAYKVNLISSFVRSLSTLSNIQTKDLNQNVRIFQHAIQSPSTRPLVLLFGWLFAKPKHLKKYAEMYVLQGFDVISVRVFLQQLLRPVRVQSLMTDVLDLCNEEDRKGQQILVHCLSVGGYMYGEVLTNIQKHPERYDDVSKRFCGQIFDSVIDVYGIPGGVARAVTHNKFIGNKIDTGLEWYLTKYPSITGDFIEASEAFHENRLRLPSIFLYSTSDPVCNPDHYNGLVRQWCSEGLYASTRFWDDTPHVSAFKKHRTEYTETVSDFIKTCGVIDDADGNTELCKEVSENETMCQGIKIRAR